MIVKFTSTATGELIMMSDAARPLLQAIGKTCAAEGIIDKSEMLQAVRELERYLDRVEPETPPVDEEKEKLIPPMLRPVSLRQRAWPLIRMLNRTAQTRKESRVIWHAAKDFETPEE